MKSSYLILAYIQYGHLGLKCTWYESYHSTTKSSLLSQCGGDLTHNILPPVLNIGPRWLFFGDVKVAK